MEDICGIRCIFNEDEARFNKAKCIKKYKRNIKAGKILEKVNVICIAIMVLALVAFVYMYSCARFIDWSLYKGFRPYMFSCGIVVIALFVVSSILDTVVFNLLNSSVSDSYDLAEEYLAMKEKGEKIVDAKIAIEEEMATLHLFVEEYDDICGKVVKERKFENIQVANTNDMTRLDINSKMYFKKY